MNWISNNKQKPQNSLAKTAWTWTRRNQETLGFAFLATILAYSTISSVVRNGCSAGNLFGCKLELEAFFGAGTLVLAYFGYLYTREQLRLHLFSQRLALYNELVNFLSSDFNTHDKDTLELAQKSFRGLGYHTYKALFGDDIEHLMKRIQEATRWLNTQKNCSAPINSPEHIKWRDAQNMHFNFLSQLPEQLPEIFRPYLYFGNYRHHQ